MIERGFGLLQRQPGVKSLAKEWAEHKREERDEEEAKYARHGFRGWRRGAAAGPDG